MRGLGDLKVTACLITREDTYPEEIRGFREFPFDEVLIATRSPGLWRRYELARGARNEHVYFQDDDYDIDVRELFKHYDGVRLTNAVSRGHFRAYQKHGHTLVSWGAFLPKRLIDFSRWTARYGDRMRHHVFGPDGTKVDRCEDDRIFTWLARPHHNLIPMPFRHCPRSARLFDETGSQESRAECHRLLEAL